MKSRGLIGFLLSLLVLTSCYDFYDDIVKINERLDGMEQTKDSIYIVQINSVKEQIEAIDTSIFYLQKVDLELKEYVENLQICSDNLEKNIIAVDEKIEKVKIELKNDISVINADLSARLDALKAEMLSEHKQLDLNIAVLQEQYAAIKQDITNLEEYTQSNSSEVVKDWANSTFVTLEQYDVVVSDVSKLKIAVESINSSMSELETRLKKQIVEDISAAVSSLEESIQKRVNEVTDNYTDAISKAKEDITTAYTETINTSIASLETSLKSWVNEQLTGYCKISDLESKLKILKTEFEDQLNAQKTYLEGLITALSDNLTQKISENKALIETLRTDMSTVQGNISENQLKITDNAEKIASNATQIALNTQSIENNKALIEANIQLINENKTLIEGLSSSSDQTDQIAENAEAIANHATLIAQNTLIINNHSTAISENAAAIEQLENDLASARTELTQSYQSAVSTAISTMDGKLQSAITTINSRIDSEVSAFNTSISTIEGRLTLLETDINSIKTLITALQKDIEEIKQDISALFNRIQSITYIPRYDDGKASVIYSTISMKSDSYAELDFQIYPKDVAKDIAGNWADILSVKAVYTQMRGVSFVDMPIVSCQADESNGVLTVKVSGVNLSDDFFEGTQSASATLCVSDESNHIESAYVPLLPITGQMVPSSTQIFYTSIDEEVVDPFDEDAFGVNVISNVYENGLGVITFDGNVVTIGEEAFYQKTALTSVSLPNSVTEISSKAFYECTGLTGDLEIPESVKEIGELAFGGCTGYTGKLIIGSNVTKIADNAFVSMVKASNSYHYQAHRLNFSSIYCKAIVPPSVIAPHQFESSISSFVGYYEYGSFGYVQKGSVFVPNESLSAYQSNESWSKSFAEFIGF